MTFAQTKKKVLEVLRFWNRPANTVSLTLAEAAHSDSPTVQMLLEAARREPLDLRRLTPQEMLVLSPEFVRRFAETTVNPDYYCTVTVSNGPPSQVTTCHLPNPE